MIYAVEMMRQRYFFLLYVTFVQRKEASSIFNKTVMEDYAQYVLLSGGLSTPDSVYEAYGGHLHFCSKRRLFLKHEISIHLMEKSVFGYGFVAKLLREHLTMIGQKKVATSGRTKVARQGHSMWP